MGRCLQVPQSIPDTDHVLESLRGRRASTSHRQAKQLEATLGIVGASQRDVACGDPSRRELDPGGGAPGSRYEGDRPTFLREVEEPVADARIRDVRRIRPVYDARRDSECEGHRPAKNTRRQRVSSEGTRVQSEGTRGGR
jgi:hypothetical protein